MPETTSTILIVDDEKNIRRTLQMVLEGEGYATLEAETAEQALKILAAPQRPVDLAIFDVKLPAMSGLEALESKDPLEILAWQYDIVCNGIELSSGAIRNHRPDIMYKAFEIAGYTREEVDTNFAGMINAFKFGAPPHGGSAPGIDRIVMLLADEPNIREVILFPMNQKAEDLMMNAPSEVTPKQLKELSIRVVGDAAPAAKVNPDKLVAPQ